MKTAGALAVLIAAMMAAAPSARAGAPSPAPVDARADVQAPESDETGDLLAWDGDDDDFLFADEAGGGPGPGARGPMAGGRGMGRQHMGPGGMHGGMGMGMRHGGPGMRGGMGGGTRGGMMGARMAQLDLSEAQRDRMHAIREAQQRKGIQMRADLQLARLDMAKLMRADKPDQAAINAQIDRMSRLRADAAKTRVGAHLEMRSVLTADQLKKMREHAPMMERKDGKGAKPGAGKSAAPKASETLHR